MLKSLLCAVLAVGLLAAVPGTGQAQRGSYGTFTWNMSLPTGDTNDFINNDSWLGLSFEGHRFLNDRSSLGLVFGWNEFYFNTDELIPLDNGAISGQQYRHLNSFPMLVDFRMCFGQAGAARPYLGLGAGAYYVKQFLDIGAYTISADDWHFGLAPEFGVLIPGKHGTGSLATIMVRYHYPLEAGTYLGGESKSWDYVSIGVGVSWVLGWQY